MPNDRETLTTGVEVLDGLIDGVRIGDNLVFVLGGGLSGEWLVDRFSRAADKDRLIVVDGGRAERADEPNLLRWSRRGSGRRAATSPEQAREELAAADERVGPQATVVVESLTALAKAWDDQAALDLFMWACPRLYRRHSVALWLVERSAHDDQFLRRLFDVTQVVVALNPDGDTTVDAEVLKADGRSAGVVGRRLRARLLDGDLVDATLEATARRRLGETLRELRTRRGVGQAELARQVGISPSALSQAERGVTSVSAETLMRIWELLGVPWIEPGTEPGYRVHRRTATPAVALAAGVSGRRVADARPSVWQLTFAPRSSGRTPLFAVKAPETVTVVRGVLQVGVAGGTETLHEGDALVAVSTAIVSWANPSDGPAEVVWSISD